MTAAARDVAEAADEGEGHPAAARSQTVVTAITDGLRDAATTDGGHCGSREQEAAAHRYASKASKGGIAGRGAALLRREKSFGTPRVLQAASCPL